LSPWSANQTLPHTFTFKAHTGVIGNEFAYAIAKHAALNNYGNDITFLPPSPDSNPFTHICWTAEEKSEISQSDYASTQGHEFRAV